MTEETRKSLEFVKRILHEASIYEHAGHVLEYDMQTACPEKGMEEQGDVGAFMFNQAFRLKKSPKFIEAAEALYTHREELEEFDRAMAEALHREYRKVQNITVEMDAEFQKTINRAYVSWMSAKQNSDYAQFLPALTEVKEINRKRAELRENAAEDIYEELLGDYERGMMRKKVDDCFEECKKRLIPLLEKIKKSPKKIRTDFLSRTVTDEQQKKMAEYLLEKMDFDFGRGSFTTTEHPFTSGLGRNDIRVTTHYYPNIVMSNIYSIIHEGGHALFEQLQPMENYDHFISGEKTMGMHESVSRFYENLIGRSEPFIHLIYPKMKEIFPQVLEDVTERELYEAVNVVEPSLIRVEADEFTYTFHIIIRYEIEKMMMDGSAKMEDLPKIWGDKYEEYLGIRPEDDKTGILQDVHWTSGFGYFPTYALGNMYNAMYYQEMKKELDVEDRIRRGDFKSINCWMKEHVFAKADRQTPGEWIREITGRDLTPDDFIDYLERKYSTLYEL